jgi:carbamoyl-phosphate synthase large subunit
MTSILVTGVGGGVGQSVIKALQETNYIVVGVDSDELAAGLHAVSQAYKGHPALDPRYVDRLLEICARENCRMIIPGLDIELPVLAANRSRFEAANIIPVVSDAKVVDICDDKLKTQEFLLKNGFRAPWTTPLAKLTTVRFPLVLKPQYGGARARNTYVVRDETELHRLRQIVDEKNCIAQEFIDGDEYTCGSVNFDGRCEGVIVMRRILRDGDTYKAFVEFEPRIEAKVREVAEALRPFGACNFQLRFRNGEPWIFEINARCSGTTAARMRVGFNEPRMVADYLLKGTRPTFKISKRTILRYWNEIVIEDTRLETLAAGNALDGDGTRL